MARTEPAAARDPYVLFEALPDGIIVVDLEGRIVYVNPQLAELARYEAADLIGRPIEDLVPEAQRDQHRAHRADYAAKGMPTRPMGTHLRIRLRTRNREEVPVDIALRPFQTEHGTHILAAVREAGERVRAQERIQALLEVSQLILADEPSDEVLALVARRARQLVDGDGATVSVPSGDGAEMVVAVADGEAEDVLKGSSLPLHSSLTGDVYSRGATLVIRDAADVHHQRHLLGSLGFGPSVVVALSTPGTTFGALTVSRREGREPFADPEVQVVELFASQAAVALDYSRVRDELRRLAVMEDRERIARELHDGVIQSLFAVGMNLQASAMLTGPGDLRGRLEKAVGELDRVIGDLRGYIFGLRPGILADRQLGQAIAQIAAKTEEEAGVSIAVDVDAALSARLAPVAGDLVQLVRESLSNVARHSGAATARVSLKPVGRAARLLIEDDGHGFDVAAPSEGQGLGNLRARAARLGAELTIVSGSEDGTRVEVTLPL